MNRHAKLGVALCFALGSAGCNDFLEGPGLTENPNSATEATPRQQLIAMQANMATFLEGQLARCATIFVQQFIGSNNQQLSYCTQYGVLENEITGFMNSMYTGGGLVAMRNVQAAGVAEGDRFLEGLGKAWEALTFGTGASVWGDLPYSEANNLAILTPKLDPQQDIYTAVQARLDEAISAFNAASTTGNCEPADLIYCATVTTKAIQVGRWIRAANTLKARFHLHLVEREGNARYTAALAAAGAGINEAPTSAAQAMNGQAPGDFRMFHGTVQDVDANIWSGFATQRADIVAGHSFITILTNRGDPRISQYWDRNSENNFRGADQNNTPVGGPPSLLAAARRLIPNAFRQPIVTWAENQLILAEAHHRLGNAVQATVHVNNVRVAVGMAPLALATFEDVMLEKHIAMFQNIEAWNDFKRTCIPLVTPYQTAAEVLGRLPYGSTERNANPNIPLPSAYPTGTTGVSQLRNWNDPNPCPRP
jgi:hypothetical protein